MRGHIAVPLATVLGPSSPGTLAVEPEPTHALVVRLKPGEGKYVLPGPHNPHSTTPGTDQPHQTRMATRTSSPSGTGPPADQRADIGTTPPRNP